MACQLLNEILGDTTILYSLYKKHHWLVRRAYLLPIASSARQAAEEQLELIDQMAERVQTLGGVAIADPVASPRSPASPSTEWRRGGAAMLSRLLEAHEIIVEKIRDAIEQSAKSRDYGTNDLLTADVLRRHELQVWLLAEHLVAPPPCEPDRCRSRSVAGTAQRRAPYAHAERDPSRR